ncbi:IS66 family insertion sequence element accessory protein TnpB [Rhodoferax ferrireducens]|uniref:IS66 family insertion sequence element accessory protein TnpB n=1 Tax=Rhodoferax ferrireducens TaxID=192843 RepID=UPI000E0DBCA8|nr:IS66 family insertion sequence element accessory protein TnpB [Rhodoferax ferrireducens]
MFFPEGHIRVYLYGQPVDMRKSYDGLYALARQGLQQDPLNGQLFAFVNRRATQIKVLYFDRSGWCLWAKRLEAGRFIGNWRDVCDREMDYTGLKLLLEGIEVKRHKKRYRLVRNQDQHGMRDAAAPIPSCPC